VLVELHLHFFPTRIQHKILLHFDSLGLSVDFLHFFLGQVLGFAVLTDNEFAVFVLEDLTFLPPEIDIIRIHRFFYHLCKYLVLVFRVGRDLVLFITRFPIFPLHHLHILPN
jgi:hypothetical protein